jgi:hypothetical protein
MPTAGHADLWLGPHRGRTTGLYIQLYIHILKVKTNRNFRLIQIFKSDFKFYNLIYVNRNKCIGWLTLAENKARFIPPIPPDKHFVERNIYFNSICILSRNLENRLKYHQDLKSTVSQDL